MSLAILYLASRAWNLLHLPPFVDELLYIRWAEAISSSYQNIWLPVTEDGQPPLFFWLAGLLKYFTRLDTLLILRALSILFGLIVLCMLIKIGTKLVSRQLGIILGLIYTLFPMFLWYDRLAMRESLVTLAGITMIYGLLDRLIYQSKHGSYLVLLGFALGIMTKGTAMIFVPLIIASYLLYSRQIKLNKSDITAASLLILLLLFVYIGAPSVIAKGETFLLSPSAMIGRLYPNLYSTVRWILEYSTLPVVILGLFGSARLVYFKHQSLPLILTILVVPLCIEIIASNIYFPRYFLWALPAWLIMVAYGSDWVLRQRLGWVALFLLFVPSIVFDYKIVMTPLSAPLPAIERWQYITGWPSGYGIEAIAKKIGKLKIDTLVVEPNEACKTGLPYYGASNYSVLPTHDLSQIDQHIQQGRQVYLCLNVADKFDFDGISKEVLRVDRPELQSSLRIYQLTE